MDVGPAKRRDHCREAYMRAADLAPTFWRAPQRRASGEVRFSLDFDLHGRRHYLHFAEMSLTTIHVIERSQPVSLLRRGIAWRRQGSSFCQNKIRLARFSLKDFQTWKNIA